MRVRQAQVERIRATLELKEQLVSWVLSKVSLAETPAGLCTLLSLAITALALRVRTRGTQVESIGLHLSQALKMCDGDILSRMLLSIL